MIVCPVCEKDNIRKIKTVEEYFLYKCSNCDLIFAYPMKSPGSDFYENTCLYYKIERLLFNQQLGWPQKIFLRDKTPPSGKLLDIGCGAGLFVSRAYKRGYDVSGIDFNKKAIDMARERFNFKKIYPFTLEKFVTFEKEKFDIISLFEVLEHLDNPLKVFRQIKKVLRVGGYLVLSVPNRERSIDTFTGMDLPPNHLTQWNETAVKYILSRFGFTLIKLEKGIRKEDIASYISIKSSIGLVKKKVKMKEIEPLSDNTVKLLRFLSGYKAKLVYCLGSILWLPFVLMNKQGSTIYALARLDK